MLDSNKFQEYFDQYNNYSKDNGLGAKYLEFGKIISQTKYYRLLYYSFKSSSSSQSHFSNNNTKEHWNNKIFLVIPSIFNSPEILFLSRDKNFIDNLRKVGEVFLVDWLEVKNPKYLLNDYVKRIIEVINKLGKKNISSINIIGHCIGGNLAIAASVLAPTAIKTLTLLTVPWDFTHFFYIRQAHRYFNLDYYVDNLSVIPKIHIQILFFLLFPNHFSDKLDKFFSLTSGKEQDLAFRIENWLMSGNNLSKATYCQIIQNILDDNIFVNLKWKINNIVIDPSVITQPVYIVTANNDQIVPKSSILSLHQSLKNSTLLKVEGGHISYLINDKLVNLFKEYKK